MTCVLCRHGETEQGFTTITLECDSTTLGFKHVPAQVCDNCGEAYVDEATTQGLLVAVEEAVDAGVQVEIREFVAA